MSVIKCLKLKCECGKEGLAQVFLRKDGSISYARVRHYSHIDKDSHKPQFTYCKITDLEALKTLLLNHGISLSVANGQLGQTNNGSNNLSNSSSKLELRLAGGEGFEPSTPNLGGWCSIRAEHRERVWLGPLYSPKFPVQQLSKAVRCNNPNV
jgi:hypothetical protein